MTDLREHARSEYHTCEAQGDDADVPKHVFSERGGGEEQHGGHRQHQHRHIALAEHRHAVQVIDDDGDVGEVVGADDQQDGQPGDQDADETEGRRHTDPTAKRHIHVHLDHIQYTSQHHDGCDYINQYYFI